MTRKCFNGDENNRNETYTPNNIPSYSQGPANSHLAIMVAWESGLFKRQSGISVTTLLDM